MKTVPVFITYSNDVPDNWIKEIQGTIDDFHKEGGDEKIRFYSAHMGKANQDQRTNQEGLNKEIDQCEIYLYLLNTKIGKNAVDEFERALARMKNGEPIKPLLAAKKYEPGSPLYEESIKIYNDVLRKDNEPEEVKNKSGRYYRFSTVDDLGSWFKERLNEYVLELANKNQAEIERLQKEKEERDERRRSSIIRTLSIILVAILVVLFSLLFIRSQARSDALSRYNDSIRQVEKLISKNTEPSLLAAKDSLDSIEDRFAVKLDKKAEVRKFRRQIDSLIALLAQNTNEEENKKAHVQPSKPSRPAYIKGAARVVAPDEHFADKIKGLLGSSLDFPITGKPQYEIIIKENLKKTAPEIDGAVRYQVVADYDIIIKDHLSNKEYPVPVDNLKGNPYCSRLDYESAIRFAREAFFKDFKDKSANSILAKIL